MSASVIINYVWCWVHSYCSKRSEKAGSVGRGSEGRPNRTVPANNTASLQDRLISFLTAVSLSGLGCPPLCYICCAFPPIADKPCSVVFSLAQSSWDWIVWFWEGVWYLNSLLFSYSHAWRKMPLLALICHFHSICRPAPPRSWPSPWGGSLYFLQTPPPLSLTNSDHSLPLSLLLALIF